MRSEYIIVLLKNALKSKAPSLGFCEVNGMKRHGIRGRKILSAQVLSVVLVNIFCLCIQTHFYIRLKQKCHV